jgi:hypothetical protein
MPDMDNLYGSFADPIEDLVAIPQHNLDPDIGIIRFL